MWRWPLAGLTAWDEYEIESNIHFLRASPVPYPISLFIVACALAATPVMAAAAPPNEAQSTVTSPPAPAPAATASTPTPTPAAPAPATAVPAAPPAIIFGGYAQLLFRYHNYGPDQTEDGGSPSDHRLTFDTTRFVLELQGALAPRVSWEAEVEFEHGGPGTALELEHDEFGEFETEVEQGGEAVVEELFIEAALNDWLAIRAGRQYVEVGLLGEHHWPTQMLGAARPESETTVLPAVWSELGVSARAALGRARLTLQLINGLDSSGFSSQRWIASGHQGQFELIRATALAAALRVDVFAAPGLVVGGSLYSGDTVGNRPKDDMTGIFAPVIVGDVHATYDRAPFRVRAVAIWGALDDAERISDKNSRLPNSLGAPRTPVAEQAMAAWAEAGVDVGQFFGLAPCHRVEPFIRVERYDTMLDTGDYTFDNPRYSRTVLGGGIHYTFADHTVVVADVTHRSLGSDAYRPETTVELGLGFSY